MTANAEIILDEHKKVLTIPEGAVLYNKDKSTEAEIPDPTNEKGLRRSRSRPASATARKPKCCAGLTEGQQVILQ